MKKLFIYTLLPAFCTLMATFSFIACDGSDDDTEFLSIGGNATAPATIIGKWKLMTIDNAGNPTGTWEIYCFNADGTAYSQELDANGTPIDKHNYTYTYENGTICTYQEDGRLQDVLLNVVVTATTLTATSPDGFTATMIRINDNENGNEESTPITDSRAVDLGLSVKWASCNVGATKPEEYGGYYAWAETEARSSYSPLYYKYFIYTHQLFTKYCTESHYGTVDNKTTLEPIDDVASVKWGGAWRMPTTTEFYELQNKCKWNWTTLNGVNGYRVTGPSGNSIFLPAAGFCYYTENSYKGIAGLFWSSSLSSKYSGDASLLQIMNGSKIIGEANRYQGLSVRPVCK